jgi:hypothetical protein
MFESVSEPLNGQVCQNMTSPLIEKVKNYGM